MSQETWSNRVLKQGDGLAKVEILASLPFTAMWAGMVCNLSKAAMSLEASQPVIDLPSMALFLLFTAIGPGMMVDGVRRYRRYSRHLDMYSRSQGN